MNEKLLEFAEQAWGKHHEIFWFDGDGIERFAELVEEEERKECAKQYLEITRDAVKKAILREREECAKLCDQFAKFFGEKGEYATHELHRREWETLVGCAKAIRGRTDPGSNFKTQMNDNWAGLI